MPKKIKSKEYYIDQLNKCKRNYKRSVLEKVIKTYGYKDIKDIKAEGIDPNMIIEDYKNGISIDYILEKYHIRYYVLNHFLERNKIYSTKPRKFKITTIDDNIKEIRAIVKGGNPEKIYKMIMTISNIDNEYPSVTIRKLSRILFNCDKAKELYIKGISHKLSDDERENIKKYRENHTIDQTAVKFGVCPTTVSNVTASKAR